MSSDLKCEEEVDRKKGDGHDRTSAIERGSVIWLLNEVELKQP